MPTNLLRPIFCFLFSCFCLSASAQNFLFSPFAAEKELSSRHITCFFQDHRGFIWIGTENGLNFYNAATVKKYKHDFANKNSLFNNQVFNICEDKEGNIWISTETGISRLNVTTQQFTNYATDDKGTSLSYKCKAFSDKSGQIWVVGEGLFRFNGAKGSFEKIKLPVNVRINGFLEDTKGRCWLSTFNGLYLFDKKTFSAKRFDLPPTDDNAKKFGVNFLPVNEDAEGNLWVGTWGYGFFLILPASGRMQTIEGNAGCFNYSAQSLPDKNIVWYATNGLRYFNKKLSFIVQVTYQPGNTFSPRNDAVSALFTDRQGQLWVGYNSSGIQLVNPSNQLMQTHWLQHGANNIQSVNAFAQDGDELWAGGWYAAALCKLNQKGDIIKWIQQVPRFKTGRTSNVSDFYIDKNKTLWTSTFNGLVAIEKNGKENVYTFDTSVTRNNLFIDILPEGDSILWLSGYDNGLNRFSFSTKKLTKIGKLKFNLLWKIDADNKGNILCADNAGSLQVYHPSSGQLNTYSYDSLTGQTIYFDVKFQPSSNRIFIGSSSGLLIIDAATMKAKLLTEKDGLPANSANALEWQNTDYLWIGTTEGLSLFDTRKNLFQNFSSADGLITERIEQGLYKTFDNRLLIGMDGGFMEMNTAALPSSSKALPIIITSVMEGDSLLQPDLKSGTKTIVLPYNMNNLQFEIAMPDYLHSEDNHLLYQLQNWDADFLPTKNGIISYQKLPPGKYIFKVKGINYSGVATSNNDAIILIIEPPFWKRAWFIGSVIGLFLFLFFIVVRYISQRNLKEKLLRLEKEQAIEKERNRISRDMHDDLGSGLTKIAIMSEVVKKQLSEPEKAVQQLENISSSSRELVDNLQDIIWTLNPHHDTAQSLSEYIKEYSIKFFEPIGIEVEYNSSLHSSNIKLSEECRRNLFLTAKEAFNNIAKHAKASEVEINFEQMNAKINITISDNGRGFTQQEQRSFGNGLRNAEQRMQQVNGSYEIRSQKGKGTTVKLSCHCTT